MEELRYDLALSFESESRPLAQFLAMNLREDGYKIFYDEFEQVVLWGRDLTIELPVRYRSSKYCMILISDAYLDKMWTIFERQTIISDFLKRKGSGSILPVRLNGCNLEVPGLSDLVGYIEIDSELDNYKLLSLTRSVIES